MDLAAVNAAMSRRIVDEPAAPLVDGGYALRVLRTTGRRSAEPRETPIAVVAREGRLYLVSPDAGRAWVRNLAADPRCALVAADGADPRTAVPVTPAEAASAVRTYLRAMTQPWALGAFPVGPDASLDEISAHLGEMAVLQLEPSDDGAG
jgi:deazaflavin-dependent oxidoreductase (nitroreductase family)